MKGVAEATASRIGGNTHLIGFVELLAPLGSGTSPGHFCHISLGL